MPSAGIAAGWDVHIPNTLRPGSLPIQQSRAGRPTSRSLGVGIRLYTGAAIGHVVRLQNETYPPIWQSTKVPLGGFPEVEDQARAVTPSKGQSLATTTPGRSRRKPVGVGLRLPANARRTDGRAIRLLRCAASFQTLPDEAYLQTVDLLRRGPGDLLPDRKRTRGLPIRLSEEEPRCPTR